MAHKAKKAPSDKVDSAIDDSIQEHKELLDRLHNEEVIIAEKIKKLSQTGLGEIDLTVDGFIPDHLISTDRVTESTNVSFLCTYNSTESVNDELTVFGE